MVCSRVKRLPNLETTHTVPPCKPCLQDFSFTSLSRSSGTSYQGKNITSIPSVNDLSVIKAVGMRRNQTFCDFYGM